MGEKTCCVTGHRDVPVGKEQYVEEALRKEVLAAIAAGYTRFISGFADGVDLTFAAIDFSREQERFTLLKTLLFIACTGLFENVERFLLFRIFA